MQSQAGIIDVAVIGAGAAGLVAAALAARQGRARVVVLEKNRKAGAKILMSGGTRCNVTQDCDAEGIMQAFGRQGRFLRQALQTLSPQETVAMFHRLGVATKVEPTGKVFPQSDRAVEVRDALLRQATGAGAELRLGCGATDLVPQDDAFAIATSGGTMLARRVIVTVGGKSWPGCGTTGDGYRWLQRMGHTVSELRPALVPLVGGEPWMRSLSGLTLGDVQLTVLQRRAAPDAQGQGERWNKRPLAQRQGGFLFTHFGFSGPAVMDVSRELTEQGTLPERRLMADLTPSMAAGRWEDWLADKRRTAGGRAASAALTDWVPRRLAEAIAEHCGADAQPLAELSRGVLHCLYQSLRQLQLSVRGSRGFEKAEVTAGGVSLKEIDPRSMQSRRVPGLYLAGEILDLDGWIGGYNFQSAFSTGALAGLAAGA